MTRKEIEYSKVTVNLHYPEVGKTLIFQILFDMIIKNKGAFL